MQSIQTGWGRVGRGYSSARRSTVILCLLEHLLDEQVLRGVCSLGGLSLSLVVAALHSELLLGELLRGLWAGVTGLNLVLCGEGGLLNH